MDDRRRDGEPPPHALRVVGDEPFGLLCQLDEIEQLDRPPRGLLAAQAVHPAAEDEVLATGEPLEERELLEDDPDLRLHRDRLAAQVVAEDLDLARVGAVDAGQQGDGGRFARAVGTEEGVEGAGRHLERQAIDRGEAREALDEAFAADRGAKLRLFGGSRRGEGEGGGRHRDGRGSGAMIAQLPTVATGGREVAREGGLAASRTRNRPGRGSPPRSAERRPESRARREPPSSSSLLLPAATSRRRGGRSGAQPRGPWIRSPPRDAGAASPKAGARG